VGFTSLGSFFEVEVRRKSDPEDSSYVGKLKKNCPMLYDSLSAWERDTIENLVRMDSGPQEKGGGSSVLDVVSFLLSLLLNQ
jgi:hypothetical protein